MRRAAARRIRARGFTLVEMMVTVAIAAALVGLGAPSLRSLLARHAVANEAGAMLDAVRLARSEAMKRGGPVILCKTNPLAASACSTDARVGWQTWLVYADANRSGASEAGEPVVRAQPTVPARVLVTADARLASVRFESTGIVLASSAPDGVVFVLSPVSGAGAAETGERAARRQLCLNSRGDAVVVDGAGACP